MPPLASSAPAITTLQGLWLYPAASLRLGLPLSMPLVLLSCPAPRAPTSPLQPLLAQDPLDSLLQPPFQAALLLAGSFDEWEGSVEKELSAVVRQLPEGEAGAKLECPVCLSNCPRQRDGWVVFACTHGVCARCFQHLIDTQVLERIVLACSFGDTALTHALHGQVFPVY